MAQDQPLEIKGVVLNNTFIRVDHEFKLLPNKIGRTYPASSLIIWLWVSNGHMDNIIARAIGIALRSSFFKNGTSDAMMDSTLSANAD